jgi:hypothetical protein
MDDGWGSPKVLKNSKKLRKIICGSEEAIDNISISPPVLVFAC